MLARAIDVCESIGRTLCTTIFGGDGKKLFPRGHVIKEEDVGLLEAAGIREVWVLELEEDEVGEDDPVLEPAREIGLGSLEIKIAAGGRSNLVATAPCCILVEGELLKQINYSSSIAVATVWNWTYAIAGQRIATIKSTPLAVAKAELAAALSVVKEKGPILRACPIRSPAVAVLYCDPFDGARARRLFEKIMFERLQRFATSASLVLSSQEREESVARALQHLLRAKPTCVLIASTTAPAGPDDAVGRGMIDAGCRIESFLAPVEPGNLLLVGYKDEIPVVAAPGCFRSPKPTVVDLILPPMLARCPISATEIASLGPVGLLSEP
jgi:molybdenum cofactor cytidylyltransferase